MKIKVQKLSYKEVISLPTKGRFIPKKPNILFRTLLKIVSLPELIATRFKLNKINMDKLPKTPCLYLMNHSSFTDLKIAVSVLFPKPVNIISTLDGLVGQEWLMRNLGCVPTRKFIPDPLIVKDLNYCLKKLKSNVLMYPEAGYTFDGTCVTLPDSLGKCIKLLGVPVVMIKTYGAFLRDPLYNNLQKRKIKISADMEFVLSPEDISSMSVAEINAKLKECFTFDGFKWQKDNDVKITEDFRADGLERVLYKCPACKSEGFMVGKGINIECKKCGKKYELTHNGSISAINGITEFDHVPDWYKWQREEVKREIESDLYSLDTKVNIYVLKDTKALYDVGTGKLLHDKNGFKLVSDDGEIDYTQGPLYTHSLNADYFWYEIGDVICIGNNEISFYCFPQENAIVAKTRFAVEELYKINKQKI